MELESPAGKLWRSLYNTTTGKFLILWGKVKVVKRCTIYFFTFWHLVHWNPLTNDRDMVISLLVDQVWKMTPKPIGWILQPLQQPILCVCLYDRHFQISSLVMWLLLLWISALHSSNWPYSWYHSSQFMDPCDQSHYQAADLNCDKQVCHSTQVKENFFQQYISVC